MTESELKQLIKKLTEGTASKEDHRLLETMEAELYEKYKHETFQKDHDRAKIKSTIYKKVVSRIREKRRSKKWLYLAASVVFLCGIIGYSLKNTQEQISITNNSSGVKVIILDDGTRVALNKASTLSYAPSYNQEYREVFLEGEAFFDVIKDTLKPFVVTANALQTKVLGTKFNVRSQSDRVTVALFEGSVQVQSEAGDQLLRPDQKVVYNPKAQQLHVQGLERDQEIAWMTQDFNFEKTPLKEVTGLLEERFNVKVRYAEIEIGERKITANFEGESMESILRAITIGGSLKYKKISEKEILIYN